MKQPDVDITPDLFMGAALLIPSFQKDLSTWRLWVNNDGTLVQELAPAFSCDHIYKQVTVRLESKLDTESLSVLRGLVEEIGFFELHDEYHGGVTDLEWMSITAIVDNEVKRVVVSAAGYLINVEKKSEIAGYLKLWDLLTYLSPFRGTTAISLPDDEATRRLKMLM